MDAVMKIRDSFTMKEDYKDSDFSTFMADFTTNLYANRSKTRVLRDQ